MKIIVKTKDNKLKTYENIYEIYHDKKEIVFVNYNHEVIDRVYEENLNKITF